MRKFFENPEIIINVFDVENIVTQSLTPDVAKGALIQDNSLITLGGKSGSSIAKATQIFSFKENQ